MSRIRSVGDVVCRYRLHMLGIRLEAQSVCACYHCMRFRDAVFVAIATKAFVAIATKAASRTAATEMSKNYRRTAAASDAAASAASFHACL